MYKIYEVENIKFYVKYEFSSNELVPHFYHRHCVLPDDAVKTFFNITEQVFNEVNKRYEAYSEFTGIKIYYIFKQNKQDEVLIITAFYPV